MSAPRPDDAHAPDEDELEREGIPDLGGPLGGKARTGDAQEGIAPPTEHPASLDYGTTAAEQRTPESLDDRLARETPDRHAGRATSMAWSQAWSEHQYVASGDGPLDEAMDREAELVADEFDGSGAPSAEEAAMTIRSEHRPERALGGPGPDEEAWGAAHDPDPEALAEEVPAPRHLDERYLADEEPP